MKPQIYIGIDTGVNTGLAVWDAVKKRFTQVHTLKIHTAFNVVEKVIWESLSIHMTATVRVEDARLRKWFGEQVGREQLQGAGSIKRDAKIWEDFLTDLGCEFEMVAPKNNRTKVNAKSFEQMTGWQERTSEHSRDAAMLVFGF